MASQSKSNEFSIKNHVKKISAALFIFIIFSACGFCSNFGSTAKTYSAIINQGENAQFTLLFWNSEDQSEIVELDVLDHPENWEIFIEKNRFAINRTIGNELIYDSGNYIRATSVGIHTDTKNSGPGNYNIIIAARAISDEKELSFSQERIFNLTVVIRNLDKNIEENEITQNNAGMIRNKEGHANEMQEQSGRQEDNIQNITNISEKNGNTTEAKYSSPATGIAFYSSNMIIPMAIIILAIAAGSVYIAKRRINNICQKTVMYQNEGKGEENY